MTIPHQQYQKLTSNPKSYTNCIVTLLTHARPMVRCMTGMKAFRVKSNSEPSKAERMHWS